MSVFLFVSFIHFFCLAKPEVSLNHMYKMISQECFVALLFRRHPLYPGKLKFKEVKTISKTLQGL